MNNEIIQFETVSNLTASALKAVHASTDQHKGSKTMKHSDILKKTEDAIKQPFRIISVDRLNTMALHSEEKLAGKMYPPGEYGVIDVRLIVPLEKD